MSVPAAPPRLSAREGPTLAHAIRPGRDRRLALAVALCLSIAACAPAPAAPPTPSAPAPTTAAAPTTGNAAKPAAPTAVPAAAQPAGGTALGTASGPTSAPAGAASPAASAARPAAAFPAPLSPRGSLHIALPEGNTAYLAFFLAVDKGYFEKAGLDLTVVHFRGSVTQQMPRLATGDLDFLPSPTSPALFNQQSQGFGVKLVAGMDRMNPQAPVSGYLMVPADLKDQIKSLAAIKGRTLEGGVKGSPIDVFAHYALKKAGLTEKDVTLKYDVKGDPSDFLNIAKNHVADVIMVPSPAWPVLEQQQIAVRLMAAEDVAPNYQTNGLGFSSKALESNRAGVVKFLEVFLYTAREVNATGGKWTDEQVASAVKWSYGASTAEQVRALGSPITYESNGSLNLTSLHEVEDLWVEEGLLPARVKDADLIDSTPLNDDLKGVGRAS